MIQLLTLRKTSIDIDIENARVMFQPLLYTFFCLLIVVVKLQLELRIPDRDTVRTTEVNLYDARVAQFPFFQEKFVLISFESPQSSPFVVFTSVLAFLLFFL